MWIRLRQIALVATDLHRTALDISTVLGLEACHIDPGVQMFGVKNTLWPLGSQFLEVVEPIRDGTAAGRYLERRKGEGGYMVICEVDDISRRRARAEELGVRTAFDLSFPEQGHEGVQLHPADTGGSFLEMDEMRMEGGGEPGGAWVWAGMHWQPYVRTACVSAITAVELQSDDPARLAQRWSEIVEIDVIDDPDGRPTLAFDNVDVRVVPDVDGRGEGLGGIDVRVTDRPAVLAAARQRGVYVDDGRVDIAGLRINLV